MRELHVTVASLPRRSAADRSRNIRGARRRAQCSLVALLCAVVLNPATASAQVRPAARAARDTVRLTLAMVRTRALAANPELVAVRLDTAIARGELRQASVLLPFNPTAEVVAAGGGKGAEPAVSQEIELFGQRGVRRSAAGAGMDRARATIANATRRTLGDVDRSFYRLVAATQRAELATDVLTLNQRLADAAARQLAAGEISRLDYNLAVVELGRSRSRALAARRERETGAVEFRRLVGLPAATPIEPVLDSTQHPPALGDSVRVVAAAASEDTVALDADSLVALALQRRPDLAERAAAVQQARAQASLARREALPNLVVRGASERDPGSRRTFRPGIGLTLPVFNLNRGEVQARRAAATQAALERAALVSQVRADVASTLTAYRAAVEEVDVLERTVLAPARQNRRLLETAYREGEIGLPVLLLIRNQVTDAELQYWEAWLAEREAFATLAEVTGQNLDNARYPDIREPR